MTVKLLILIPFLLASTLFVIAPDIAIPEASAANSAEDLSKPIPKPDPGKLNVPLSKDIDTIDKLKGNSDNALDGFINSIFQTAKLIILPFAILMIVVQGVRITLSAGSSDTIGDAKTRIFQILIGVALFYMIGFILRTTLPFFFK